jgi:outer membrane protein assembly factor BamB
MNPTAFSPSQPWICAGGDGTRRGLFGRPVLPNSQPSRRLPLSGAAQTSVVFDAEDRALVTDTAGQVQAFAAGGSALWSKELVGGISATPAVNPALNRFYVGTHAGWLCALGTEDGRSFWQQRLPTRSDARIVSDLLVVPGTDVVIASSWGGHFHAIDGATGQTRQTWDAGISPQSGVTAAGPNHIYGLRAVARRGIEWVRFSLDREERERVLHVEPESARPAQRMVVAAAPVMDSERDRVYAVINQNGKARLLAWSITEEQILWSHDLPAAVVATPTVRNDGMIWIADLAGNCHGVQPDGQRRYAYQTGSEYLLAGGVVEMGGRLFLGDSWGRLHVVQPDGEGGLIFESDRALQARPSFDRHGNLYLPGTDRVVRVFRNHAD